jgi:hypothetical protein
MHNQHPEITISCLQISICANKSGPALLQALDFPLFPAI